MNCPHGDLVVCDQCERAARTGRDEQMRGQTTRICELGEAMHALANALTIAQGEILSLRAELDDVSFRLGAALVIIESVRARDGLVDLKPMVK